MAADGQVSTVPVSDCLPHEFDLSELTTTVYGIYICAYIDTVIAFSLSFFIWVHCRLQSCPLTKIQG